MPNNINWNLVSQQFSEGFNSTFQQGRDLVQRESEFVRTQNFQDRQLRLLEGFRRDELAETAKYHETYGNYLQGQLEQGVTDAKLRKTEGEVVMMNQGWTLTDPSVPSDPNVRTYDAYDKSWLPPPPESEEKSRMVSGAYGTWMEEKYKTDLNGNEIITNYENVIYPPTPTTTSTSDPNDTKTNGFETHYNTALSYLAELRSINQGGFGGSKEYVDTKQKATFSTYEALRTAGIGKDVLEALRASIADMTPEQQEEKEKTLNNAIDELDKQYELTPEQLKALKLWKDVGTR